MTRQYVSMANMTNMAKENAGLERKLTKSDEQEITSYKK